MKIAVLKVDNNKTYSDISKHEPEVKPSYYFQKYSNFTITQEFCLSKSDCINTLEKIYNNFDIFVNLCDGAQDDDRPGIEVVRFLEEKRKFFTGAGSTFYEPSREQMKYAAILNNINVPEYIFFFSEDEFYKYNLKKIKYPCVVKHYCSYSSIGMTENSLVYNSSELKKEVLRFIKNYGGALVEKFIDGKEYTVLVVSASKENVLVFEPVEVILPPGEKIKHFNLKWKSHSSLNFEIVNDKNISEKLKEYSIRIFKTLNGNGYARYDYRINDSGEIFFLELNPNCSIFYPENDPSSADVILQLNSNGYKLFIDSIIKYATLRYS